MGKQIALEANDLLRLQYPQLVGVIEVVLGIVLRRNPLHGLGLPAGAINTFVITLCRKTLTRSSPSLCPGNHDLISRS